MIVNSHSLESKTAKTSSNASGEPSDAPPLANLITGKIADNNEGERLLQEGVCTLQQQQQNSTKKVKVISPLGRDLSHRRWYHGFMTREEADLLCHNEGEWLVRRAQSQCNGEIYCITVRFKKIAHHIPLVRTEHLRYFVIQNLYCTEPTTLVQYCYEYAVALNSMGAVLGNYISRQDWSVRAEQLKFGKKLGSGAFGDVVAGELYMWDGRHKVAIKRLKDEKTLAVDTKLILLREASNMRGLVHPNILKFYGVHTINDPIMIIMELADGGNLLEKVENKVNPVTIPEQERYLWEIIDGMTYLESKLIIHKDLAARNCLLSKNSIKISDFGLSVVCVDNKGQKVTNNGKIPTRWRAPETLFTPAFYSNKSDVWSFGCVIYEVYSRGMKPYHEIKKAHDIRVAVRNNTLTLAAADGTPVYLAEIQKRCMSFQHDQRPNFFDLLKEIDPKRPQKPMSSFWNRVKGFINQATCKNEPKKQGVSAEETNPLLEPPNNV